MKPTKKVAVYVLSVVITAVIFIIDLLTPLGFVVWVSYQLSILLAYMALPRRHMFVIAAACTLLIMLGFLFSPSHISSELALTNRSIGILMLWTITILLVQRKQADERIREQGILLDKAHDAIIVLDLEYRIIHCNKSAERLYGWTKEEALNKNAIELLYKERSSRLIEVQKSVMEKGEWTGELHQVKKEGKEIIVDSSWTLVNDNKEEPKSILVINTDITEKKKIEEQFLRNQRMESIGTLAAGITHDINNVLSPIMLSLELLQEKFTDDESQKLIKIIERSAKRGASLIKQVQSFARGVEDEYIAFQVKHLISEIKQIVKETFPRAIEIRTDVQKDLWTIFGDTTQLSQILMNLCVNARDAMPDGGVLSISAENHFIEKNYAQLNIEAKSGPYIVISVSDTGTGIPAEMVDRIFDPFFTTKEHGEGTGLGLSTVLAIVKGHGGFINVYSIPGKGTTFRVYLPACEAVEIQKAHEQQSELFKGHGEIILVVDDEDQIREITRATLEEYGYRIFTANNGKDAITLYSKYRDEIKLVLMDMMMPVMGGQASIQTLRIINPDVKIIAVSGLAGMERQEQGAGINVMAFLSKPYTVENLLKKIHEVLNPK